MICGFLFSKVSFSDIITLAISSNILKNFPFWDKSLNVNSFEYSFLSRSPCSEMFITKEFDELENDRDILKDYIIKNYK